jgi:hypothetical protein
MSSLLLAACSSGSDKATRSPSPTPSIAGVRAYSGLSHDHLGKKSDYPHRYPQVPPVGGAHAPYWLRCDVYTSPVPEEFAVHSMEHGGIWITYRPGLDAASLETLAHLEKTNVEYVLVSPYEGLPAPVVVSTWGLQLQLPRADDPRLVQFVKAYAGGAQGGEPGTTCRKNGVTPDKARSLLQ